MIVRPIGFVLILLLLAGGCDTRQKPATGQASTRATVAPGIPAAPIARPPATAPATLPASRPAVSFIVIDGRIYEFPRAQLRLQQKRLEEPITAILFSDDPKEAIEDTYTGNSYYLRMPLSIANLHELNGAQWALRADSSARVDSPNGIFLEGTHYRLQPLDVQTEFQGVVIPASRDTEAPATADADVLVILSGRFVQYADRSPDDIGQIVQVSARLQAQLVRK